VASLIPVESYTFNASKLSGMSPTVLSDIMKLTFLDGEKVHQNPLYHCQRKARMARQESCDAAKDSEATSKAGSSEPEEVHPPLPADNASPIAASSPTVHTDHNADKKGSSKEDVSFGGRSEAKVMASMSSAGLVHGQGQGHHDDETEHPLTRPWQRPSEVTLMQMAQIQVLPLQNC
jgi:hypothetical protein